MSEKQRQYKVPEKILRELIMAKAELEALEAGGVDNWCWYSESKSDYLSDYFSDCDPDFFETNDVGFDMIVDQEINRFEEV